MNALYAFSRGLATAGIVLGVTFVVDWRVSGSGAAGVAAIVAAVAALLFLYRFDRFGFFCRSGLAGLRGDHRAFRVACACFDIRLAPRSLACRDSALLPGKALKAHRTLCIRSSTPGDTRHPRLATGHTVAPARVLDRMVALG